MVLVNHFKQSILALLPDCIKSDAKDVYAMGVSTALIGKRYQ